jgi:hypothetical protein
MAEKLSTKQEIKKIKYTMTSKLILLSALWAVWSFFYSGSWVCLIQIISWCKTDKVEYIPRDLLYRPSPSFVVSRIALLLHVSVQIYTAN